MGTRYDIGTLPKRCVVNIAMFERETDRTVLDFERKLPCKPWFHEYDFRLTGDRLTVKVTNTETRQVWKFDFLRQPNGKFLLVKEEGDFQIKDLQ